MLVFERLDEAGTGLWILPLTGEKKPVPVAIGPGWSNTDGCLSPDARLLSYTSHEAERPEVFVVPVPPTGERWQVSTHGGAMPRWRSDGRELFYVAPDRELMAVPVTPGAAFRAGVPQRLFEVRIPDINDIRRWYAPSPDGTRFLVLERVDDRPPPITVVTGWRNLLSRASDPKN